MSNYKIFSVLGLEIEYMLVNRTTLAVEPKSDILLRQLAGEQVNEMEMGPIALSNEFVLHVVELKDSDPKPLDAPVQAQFQEVVLKLQPLLEKMDLQFLPSGAHPWMDPLKETKRWPHGDSAIYKQYDKIFNCQGHGWANLQSMHVNLPFANDEEFNRLHNSVRLLLPLLPALAASTPYLDGKATGLLDSRLDFYGKNQLKIPSISGQIIPEFIKTPAQYQQDILTPMYKEIQKFDAENILQYEWLNSRAAIPKFERMSLEIRILDSQECVNADVAIARAIFSILKHWDEYSDYHLTHPIETGRLKYIYDQTIKEGFDVFIEDKDILKQWQLPAVPMKARDAWALLIERISPELDKASQHALEFILSRGNLSQRILAACRSLHPERATLNEVYKNLGQCLLHNELFIPS